MAKMGQVSHEPSMEEILSSIKRIIAEDGGDAPNARARRQAKPVSLARDSVESAPPPEAAKAIEPDESEILELTDTVPVAEPEQPKEPVMEPKAAVARAESLDAELVSAQAAIASRDALASLSRLIMKPEDGAADNTLEGMVREMLRPMLKDWLDSRLPDLVEAMVAKEIARITGQQG